MKPVSRLHGDGECYAFGRVWAGSGAVGVTGVGRWAEPDPAAAFVFLVRP
jgi:hypothetical protein